MPPVNGPAHRRVQSEAGGRTSVRRIHFDSIDDLIHAFQRAHGFLCELLLVETGQAASKKQNAFMVLAGDLATR